MSSIDDNDGLTDLQRRFCEEYCVDFKGGAAATRAGYKEGDASHQAARANLRNEKCLVVIRQLMDELKERTFVNAAWVQMALLENYHRSMQANPILDREGNPVGVFEYEGGVANKSLELIGKTVGAFTEQVNVTADKGVIVLPANGFEKDDGDTVPEGDT